jgi:thiol-disulfide isomerase/thioredoxin
MNPMKIFMQFLFALIIFAIIGFFIFAPNINGGKANYEVVKSGAAAAIAQASFYDLNEKVQPLAQWKDKVIVLNFWATWCPPCRAEIPEFIRFQKQYGAQGVQFIGVAIDQKNKVQDFAKEVGMNYPVLLGDLAGIDLAKRIGNNEGGLPFSVIVDRTGKVVLTQLGTISYEKLETVIKPLL